MNDHFIVGVLDWFFMIEILDEFCCLVTDGFRMYYVQIRVYYDISWSNAIGCMHTGVAVVVVDLITIDTIKLFIVLWGMLFDLLK